MCSPDWRPVRISDFQEQIASKLPKSAFENPRHPRPIALGIVKRGAVPIVERWDADERGFSNADFSIYSFTTNCAMRLLPAVTTTP